MRAHLCDPFPIRLLYVEDLRISLTPRHSHPQIYLYKTYFIACPIIHSWYQITIFCWNYACVSIFRVEWKSHSNWIHSKDFVFNHLCRKIVFVFFIFRLFKNQISTSSEEARIQNKYCFHWNRNISKIKSKKILWTFFCLNTLWTLVDSLRFFFLILLKK